MYFIFLYFIKATVISDARMRLSIWKERDFRRDTILDNYIIHRFYNISKVKCAARCDTYLQCKSFHFKKPTKFCQLNAVDLNNPGSRTLHVIPSLGTKYYTKSENATVREITLTSATSPATVRCSAFEYSNIDNKYYTYFSSPVVKMEDADTKCQQIGGRLAQLKTALSLEASRAMIENKTAATHENPFDIAFWLAARFNKNRKKFYWLHDNGVILTDSALWYDNQPAMIKGHANDTECVVQIPAYHYLLDDYECIKSSIKIYPLCECT